MIRPLHDNIVLVKEPAAATTASGIVLGQSSAPDNVAVVEAAGPESLLTPGMKVIYKPDAGYSVSLEGKDYVVLQSKDILAEIK